MDVPGMDAAGGLFAPANRGKLEASFGEFISRPENKPLIERHQRKEVEQLVRLREEAQLRELHAKVGSASAEAQRALAPYLASPALLRIIQTFSNEQPAGAAAGDDFDRWATNPQVLQLLSSAKKLLQQGALTEAQLEEALLQQLKQGKGGEGGQLEERQGAQLELRARVPSDQLVGALNEHLSERRAGNQAYKAGDYCTALHHYERALAIVDFVAGTSEHDQQEIERNKVASLLNVAAVHLAQHEYGSALQACSRAMQLEPENITALLRCCKAHLGRYDLQEAAAVLGSLQQLDPFNEELPGLQARLAQLRRAAQQQDSKLYARMFAAPPGQRR